MRHSNDLNLRRASCQVVNLPYVLMATIYGASRKPQSVYNIGLERAKNYQIQDYWALKSTPAHVLQLVFIIVNVRAATRIRGHAGVGIVTTKLGFWL